MVLALIKYRNLIPKPSIPSPENNYEDLFIKKKNKIRIAVEDIMPAISCCVCLLLEATAEVNKT